MRAVSEVVAMTLRQMRAYVEPGMSAKEVDEFGGRLLKKSGANSAPYKTYKFPGWTCICVNHEVAHGVPHARKIFREGDLINIDVSAELHGYWADNGGSFILGKDVQKLQPLVDASKSILKKAIEQCVAQMRINKVGQVIEREANALGYKVIRNLAGHGVGRSLHEDPHHILNFKNNFNLERFKENSVVAIETFISTKSSFAVTIEDGWTLIGDQGGFVAQHEHTILITKKEPVILTEANGIWD